MGVIERMTKIVIIYDSNTGNTQKMAEAIADGAKSVSMVDVVLKKIGEPFSLSVLLGDADAIILGSPAHYAYATPDMRDLLSCIKGQVVDGNFEVNTKLGAIFGSYGWDGAKSTERFALALQNIGFKMYSSVLSKPSLLPQPQLREKTLKECYTFGKTIAEQIS
jgi:NAD(P)H dehydrogenase (quinone)